jgi:hypothetical protein
LYFGTPQRVPSEITAAPRGIYASLAFFYCHLVTRSGLIIKEPKFYLREYEPRKNSGIRLGKRTEGGAGCAGFRGAAYAIRMALGSFIIAEFHSAK